MSAPRYRVRVVWRAGFVTFSRLVATRAEAEIMRMALDVLPSAVSAAVEAYPLPPALETK